MKKLLTAVFIFSCIYTQAQMGIGTTSPNSTLDVRGSLSTPITMFTGNTTAGASDNLLVFTGTSAATLTLPTAVGITGRGYWVKNASSNSSTLTIATTSSQTVDNLSSWSLTQANKTIHVVSNGTNWYATAESLPGNSGGTSWIHGGNSLSSIQNIGTTSNHSLPFITNNTERMRIGNTGNVAIGTSSWNGTNPEKLLVDAGTTTSINVISGKGNINNYLQLNIQNSNSGTAASSDIVATADNGNETTNYVDLGINSSGYSSSGILGGANNAYLYSAGNDFIIGNSATTKDLLFFTGGTATTNERMRILDDGKVGIGTSNPNYLLHLHKGSAASNWMQITNSASGTGTYDGFFYGVTASGQPQIWGEGDMTIITGSGTTNNTTMTLTEEGNVGINTSTFDGTNPERLLVDAGTTTSFNVISGKGTINNYLQLNIQNKRAGTVASSDVVATANNGSETANFIDMGINSSGYSSSGILGGANTTYLYGTGGNMVVGNAASNRDLIFFTGGTSTTNERMRIDDNGSVGIGTSTFNGTNAERLIVDAGSGGSSFQNVIVGKGNTNSYAQLNIQNINAGTAASSDVVATANNGTESVNFIDMGINGGGNTSTGVLGGANRAYLYATGQDFAIGNATAGDDLIFFTGGTATGNERMRLTSTGHLVPGANNTYNLGSSTLRWATIYSQNALNTSDARLKTNIRKLNYGLSSILNLHPVQYNWKEGNDKDGIGFLAQELRNVIPEVVVGDESKETLAVNYIELIPVLVNAIKEQQQQIDALKKKIAVLENK